MVDVIKVSKSCLYEHPYFAWVLTGSVEDFIKFAQIVQERKYNADILRHLMVQLEQLRAIREGLKTFEGQKQNAAEQAKIRQQIESMRALPLNREPDSVKDFQRGSIQLDGISSHGLKDSVIVQQIADYTQNNDAAKFIGELGGQNFCNFFLGFAQMNMKPLLRRRALEPGASEMDFIPSLLAPTHHHGIWRKESEHEFHFYITICFGYAIAEDVNSNVTYGVFKKPAQQQFCHIPGEQIGPITKAMRDVSITPEYEDMLMVHAKVVLNTQEELGFYFDQLNFYARGEMLYKKDLNQTDPHDTSTNDFYLFNELTLNPNHFSCYSIYESTASKIQADWPPKPGSQNQRGYYWWPSSEWWYGKERPVKKTMQL